jgi:hypothetical protein
MMKNIPGYYQGRHYTAYVDQVRTLEREGSFDMATQLLLRLIDATEAENNVEHCGAAPWYYKELAHIYRTRGNNAAAQAIIERFNRQPYGNKTLRFAAPLRSSELAWA